MVDPVSGPFPPDVATDQVDELVIGCSGSERAAQVRFLQREQTRPYLALGRDPKAVARVAERLGDAADHADATGGAVGEPVPGRRFGIGPLGDQRVDRIDGVDDPGGGEDLGPFPRMLRIEGVEGMQDEPSLF